MHGPVRENLEALLAGGRTRPPLPDHLSSCDECLSELNLMKAQCSQLAALRAPGPVEPVAGFYARVLQRIEESEIESFWAFFAYTPFGKRLAAASLTIALALSAFIFSQERHEQRNPTAPALAVVATPNSSLHYDYLVVGSPDQQRDAVLENFAVHQVSETQRQFQ